VEEGSWNSVVHLSSCPSPLYSGEEVHLAPPPRHQEAADEGTTPWGLTFGLPAVALEQDGHSKPKTN
jgi:hypothetical protein